eukprot:5896310-Pyramimonas_sp.AAC.1
MALGSGSAWAAWGTSGQGCAAVAVVCARAPTRGGGVQAAWWNQQKAQVPTPIDWGTSQMTGKNRLLHITTRHLKP